MRDLYNLETMRGKYRDKTDTTRNAYSYNTDNAQTTRMKHKRLATNIQHNPTTLREQYECMGKTLRKHDTTEILRTHFKYATNYIRAQYDTTTKTM